MMLVQKVTKMTSNQYTNHLYCTVFFILVILLKKKIS